MELSLYTFTKISLFSRIKGKSLRSLFHNLKQVNNLSFSLLPIYLKFKLPKQPFREFFKYAFLISFVKLPRTITTTLLKHIHKKRKDSLETRGAFSWILILTWNFGGGRSDSASTFFKIASASWFWCC